jgi:hypothetical protein
MGASFGSTNLIDFGWLPSAKPTFALSGDLLFQWESLPGFAPFRKDYSLIVGSSTEKARFFSASFRSG